VEIFLNILYFNRFELIGNKLIINNIEWNDQGMYQCFLTNDVGEDTRSTWLKIKSKHSFLHYLN
jgi:hypothetical protein